MSYSSILYVCMFLPAVMLFYAVMPQRHRWKVLLAASYLFFYLLSGKLVVYLLLSTLSIHQLGLWLDHSRYAYDTARKEAPGSDEKSALKAAYTRKKRGQIGRAHV